jgi:hypothetical protein
MRLLEHFDVIAGNNPDIDALRRKLCPAVVLLVRREKRLHPGAK